MAASTASLWCTANTGPSTRWRQLRVGDDHGDLDDAVALGRQARHLEVDPDQVLVVGGGGRSWQWGPAGHRPIVRGAGDARLHWRPCLRRSGLWFSRRRWSPRCSPAPGWPRARPGTCSRIATPCRRSSAPPSTWPRTARRPTTRWRRSASARSQMVFAAVVLLGWTLFGGLDALSSLLADAIGPRWDGLAYELALVVAFVADRRPARAALQPLLDLRSRGTLRLQPDDAGGSGSSTR